MKQKNWYDYKRTFTRRELLKLCWLCSIPFAGWLALTYLNLFKPHNPRGVRWK